MQRIVLIAAFAALTAAPLAAPAQEGTDDGFSLMEEGARQFFRGLQSEMAPALDEFRGLAEDLQPALRAFTAEMGQGIAEIVQRLDDIRYYQSPEILANGDILIRRRPDAPPWDPPGEDGPEMGPEFGPEVGPDGDLDVGPEGEIDL